jgi:hypothetical protein
VVEDGHRVKLVPCPSPLPPYLGVTSYIRRLLHCLSSSLNLSIARPGAAGSRLAGCCWLVVSVVDKLDVGCCSVLGRERKVAARRPVDSAGNREYQWERGNSSRGSGE